MNTDKFIYNLSKIFVYFSCINTAAYHLNPDYSILHLIIQDRESIKYFYILMISPLYRTNNLIIVIKVYFNGLIRWNSADLLSPPN